jgi:glycosyltransferase involved in cell wall biosynthesis
MGVESHELYTIVPSSRIIGGYLLKSLLSRDPSHYQMISIVMPVLNGKNLVRYAISSVICQDYDDWELVVVDNGSSDGSVEVVKRFAEVDDRISLRVYADRQNMYSAINYGISGAKGEIIGILCQDDMYTPTALSHVSKFFEKDSDLDVVCPRVLVISDYGRKVAVERVIQTDLSFKNILLKPPVEPARFFRKRLFEALGPIDDTYRISGFREWWIRASLRLDVKWASTSHICYIFRRHAGSTTSSFDEYARLRYLPEHYLMVKRLLASGLLNDEQKRLLRRRWLNDSMAGFSLSLRAGRLRDALFYLFKGSEIDYTWPLKLAKRKLLRKA